MYPRDRRSTFADITRDLAHLSREARTTDTARLKHPSLRRKRAFICNTPRYYVARVYAAGLLCFPLNTRKKRRKFGNARSQLDRSARPVRRWIVINARLSRVRGAEEMIRQMARRGRDLPGIVNRM